MTVIQGADAGRRRGDAPAPVLDQPPQPTGGGMKARIAMALVFLLSSAAGGAAAAWFRP